MALTGILEPPVLVHRGPEGLVEYAQVPSVGGERVVFTNGVIGQGDDVDGYGYCEYYFLCSLFLGGGEGHLGVSQVRLDLKLM